MKILLVSWSSLPNKGGSSIIVENLAKNFSKEEMVVLGSRQFRQEPIPTRSASGPVFHYFFSEMYFMGRGYRFFGWFRKWRFQPLVKKIKSLIASEKIEYVIGVYPNPDYCHAACLAAREMNIPFSSYFHNTYTENIAITDPNAGAIQNEIFENSEQVFVMSKGMQKFYQEKYRSNKFVPLVHTFYQYPQTKATKSIPGSDKKHYKLVAIGNFNESNIDATQRFIKAIKDHPKYSLSVYTHVPKLLLRQRGIDVDAIDHKGFISPDDIHEALQDYDICVLTHGFTGGYGEVEYKTIFPTRTIPFLLSGKPILAHSPPGSFLNDFIEENQCAELIDQASEAAILEGLERICNSTAYQEQLIEASKKTAKQFYGPQVVQQLQETLSQSSTVKL